MAWDGKAAGALKILIVSSEMTPYAKTGGLADVVGALPGALRALGHEVWVVMPKYSLVDYARWELAPFHSPMGVWMGAGQEWCSIHRAQSAEGVPVHFVEHHNYFDRWGLYHDQAHNDYLDNPRRFGFLSRAALQLCLDRGFIPDIVHANDWQTALAPAYLRTWNWQGTGLDACASLLTIHNIAYQGVYSAEHVAYLGLGWENFRSEIYESFGAVNLLKGGIHFADLVNTVSPTYAREISSPGGGHGLAPRLADKGDRFVGILNGVDYNVWSPGRDRYLPARYSTADLRGKAICKRALQERMGLRQDADVALLGVVSRLVDQKGLNLLAEILRGLMQTMHLQLVLLGTGDKALEHHFGAMAAHHRERIGVYFGFNEELAHLIEAGSDFFVMPSLFEPCGLNQLYSLRYGTLPIVRATGGLNDTVDNYDETTGSGTGFKFQDFTGSALYDTIGWAISTYYDRRHHVDQMIRAAMGRHFSWKDSALEYDRAYRRAMALRRRSLEPSAANVQA
ncbi:MAG: glycogen synthase GlgA [Armatimonadetes bacterium]|nr:glycogen synthase GlgA [Armatimonadota bacterium]